MRNLCKYYSMALLAVSLVAVSCESNEGPVQKEPEKTGFATDVDTLWFTRKGIEKVLKFESGNIAECQVVELPDGWSGRFEGADLYLTCPQDFLLSAMEGNVTVMAEFTTEDQPVTLTFAVAYQTPMTLTTDYISNVSVALSAHALTDTEGYIIGAVRKSAYSADSVIEWLNSDGRTAISAESRTIALSELVDSYEQGAAYVVYAVSAYPSDQVASGEVSYVATDLVTVSLGSDNVKWSISDVTFDSARLNATISDLPSGYHAGVMNFKDWNNYGRKNILDAAKYAGQLTVHKTASFDCSVSEFPTVDESTVLFPETEYVVWVLPVTGAQTYIEQDLVQLKFTTSPLVTDASVQQPTYELKDITFGGFTAQLTPASGAYKTYAAIRSASAIPADDKESLLQLININHCALGESLLEVSNNSFPPAAEVYLLAATVMTDGRCSQVLKQRVELRTLTYTDALTMEVSALKQGVGEVTFTIEFTGEPYDVTYMVTDNVFFTDDMIKEKLAMKQMGEATTKEVSRLGGAITVSGLTNGGEYVLYAVLRDAEGTPSQLFRYDFTHRMELDYVLNTDADYDYAKPVIRGQKHGLDYVFSVQKPDSCLKFWLFVGDPEYVQGSDRNVTNKMVTMEFEMLNETVHTESIESVTISPLRSYERIYIVWLDDNNRYHTISEFNPNE